MHIGESRDEVPSDMSQSKSQPSDDVEHLLRNARLRDDLEPLFDESIGRVDVDRMSTPAENEFLESMLAWERAPILPICQWFDPELRLPEPESLDPQELHDQLWSTIYRLFEARIVLEFTDHLSDAELYRLIYRDILPSYEKKIDNSRTYLHWDCANVSDDPEIWLRFYANEEEREQWCAESDLVAPEREDPPYPRNLPQSPM